MKKIFNSRMFIKEEPQHEGRETLRSNDTKIAAIRNELVIKKAEGTLVL